MLYPTKCIFPWLNSWVHLLCVYMCDAGEWVSVHTPLLSELLFLLLATLGILQPSGQCGPAVKSSQEDFLPAVQSKYVTRKNVPGLAEILVVTAFSQQEPKKVLGVCYCWNSISYSIATLSILGLFLSHQPGKLVHLEGAEWIREIFTFVMLELGKTPSEQGGRNRCPSFRMNVRYKISSFIEQVTATTGTTTQNISYMQGHEEIWIGWVGGLDSNQTASTWNWVVLAELLMGKKTQKTGSMERSQQGRPRDCQGGICSRMLRKESFWVECWLKRGF